MRARRRIDWKSEIEQKELRSGVLLLLLYLAAILLNSAGCSRESGWKPDHHAAESRPKTPMPNVYPDTGGGVIASTSVHSGRRLTLQKQAQRLETLRHFGEDVYGVSFDVPKDYELQSGELPVMDRGLGYLGHIPMEFSGPGGVRVATVEVPRGAHPGTDFVNAFFTVSVFPNVTSAQCSDFRPPEGVREPAPSRTIDGIEFHAVKESISASMHQYSGTFLHAYAEESCYEIGYGIVTAGHGAMDGLKKVNNQVVLQRMEKILNTLSINPPERGTNTNSTNKSNPNDLAN